MVQLLPRLQEVNKHLSFARESFTKGGFRHVTTYINGLIAVNRKTIKQISAASPDEGHHGAIQRLLNEGAFEQKILEERYLKKIKYICKGQQVFLILDDTLIEREGKKIEETQAHYSHSDDDFIQGHQFFTAIVGTQSLMLPLFPQLYSKQTHSKIEMANRLIEHIISTIKVDTVLFDSWYSDKKIIKKCMTKGVRVACPIKTNRKISLQNGVWFSLADFSREVARKKHPIVQYEQSDYKIASYEAKLNGIPFIKLIISREWNKKKKGWGKAVHLISTRVLDSPEEIIRIYSIRWCIEVYHRDIKQNLGFADAYVRKKEGIVGHAIFVALAYAVLKLFMHARGLSMSIGECCSYVRNEALNDFLQEIICIDDKEERLKRFEEVFIRKSRQV
ncbi:MAG TPA: transposase [Candidatus Nanoarchaeia archaeon]|nr:transposase [Candidatus Nanoarchaeia archaeon]